MIENATKLDSPQEADCGNDRCYLCKEPLLEHRYIYWGELYNDFLGYICQPCAEGEPMPKCQGCGRTLKFRSSSHCFDCRFEQALKTRPLPFPNTIKRSKPQRLDSPESCAICSSPLWPVGEYLHRRANGTYTYICESCANDEPFPDCLRCGRKVRRRTGERVCRNEEGCLEAAQRRFTNYAQRRHTSFRCVNKNFQRIHRDWGLRTPAADIRPAALAKLERTLSLRQKEDDCLCRRRRWRGGTQQNNRLAFEFLYHIWRRHSSLQCVDIKFDFLFAEFCAAKGLTKKQGRPVRDLARSRYPAILERTERCKCGARPSEHLVTAYTSLAAWAGRNDDWSAQLVWMYIRSLDRDNLGVVEVSDFKQVDRKSGGTIMLLPFNNERALRRILNPKSPQFQRYFYGYEPKVTKCRYVGKVHHKDYYLRYKSPAVVAAEIGIGLGSKKRVILDAYGKEAQTALLLRICTPDGKNISRRRLREMTGVSEGTQQRLQREGYPILATPNIALVPLRPDQEDRLRPILAGGGHPGGMFIGMDSRIYKQAPNTYSTGIEAERPSLWHRIRLNRIWRQGHELVGPAAPSQDSLSSEKLVLVSVMDRDGRYIGERRVKPDDDVFRQKVLLLVSDEMREAYPKLDCLANAKGWTDSLGNTIVDAYCDPGNIKLFVVPLTTTFDFDPTLVHQKAPVDRGPAPFGRVYFSSLSQLEESLKRARKHGTAEKPARIGPALVNYVRGDGGLSYYSSLTDVNKVFAYGEVVELTNAVSERDTMGSKKLT